MNRERGAVQWMTGWEALLFAVVLALLIALILSDPWS